MWVAVECHVMVYDIDTLELQGMWQAHDSPISAMVATPEGVWIGFESGELSVWVTNVRATHCVSLDHTICATTNQVEQGRDITREATFTTHSAVVSHLVRFGNHVVSAAEDKTMLVWRNGVRVPYISLCSWPLMTHDAH